MTTFILKCKTCEEVKEIGKSDLENPVKDQESQTDEYVCIKCMEKEEKK